MLKYGQCFDDVLVEDWQFIHILANKTKYFISLQYISFVDNVIFVAVLKIFIVILKKLLQISAKNLSFLFYKSITVASKNYKILWCWFPKYSNLKVQRMNKEKC